MPKPSAGQPLRRSARLFLSVPVNISGKFLDGKTFQEDTQIVTVSKYGAKVKTQLALKVGMQVKVQPKQRKESAVFRVVWVGREGTPRAGEVGLEYVQVSNLLGVNFPE